jgi:hypothetical protein
LESLLQIRGVLKVVRKDELELIGETVPLRDAIVRALELHPEAEPLVNEIATKLDLTDLADEHSPVQRERERKEIARLERTLANLRERARAIIERYPDVADLFAPRGLVATAPTAGTAPTLVAMTGRATAMSSAGARAIVLKPRGREDSAPSPKVKTTRKRRDAAQPRTKVGRAVRANGVPIILSTQAAISLVEITVEKLRAERSNDPDGPINVAITSLEQVIVELRNLQQLVESFQKDKVPEKKLPGAFEGFKRAFSVFWQKDGANFIGQSASLGLIAIATMVLYYGGAVPGAEGVLIASAVCARDPVAKVLRAAKGLAPWSK